MAYNTFIPIVNNGLVLYLDAGNRKSYPGSGTTWTDLTSNVNNGTLVNSPSFNNSNVGSFVFNGTNNYVSSFPIQISGTDSKTIEVWFNSGTTSRAGLCGTTGNVGVNGWSFLINRTTAGNLTYFHNGGSILQVSAGISINNWYQGVVVYNSTTAVGTLYLNGLQVGSPLSSFSAMSTSSFNGVIGNEDQGLTSPFKGNISIVRIYNRTLSASEVLQNYNATKLRYYTHIDSDAQRFLDATQITTESLVSAVNLLVIDLKTYGIWDKMKAIYPVVGGTAFTHKFNLKDPRDADSAFRLSFLGGGWTHSSTGAQPNGSTSYADTFLIPSSVLTLYSNHLSFYSRTNTNVGGGNEIGGQWQQTSPVLAYTLYQFNGRNSDGNAVGSISSSDANRVIYSQTSPASFVVSSRTANNSLKMYTNGVLKGTNTSINTSTYNGLPQNKVIISAFNYFDGVTSSIFNYSNKECAFATIGDGLTDTEVANFYTAVQAYQTRLGRNV
jgi:hypothetical protein